jgi:hypothetical protein
MFSLGKFLMGDASLHERPAAFAAADERPPLATPGLLGPRSPSTLPLSLEVADSGISCRTKRDGSALSDGSATAASIISR